MQQQWVLRVTGPIKDGFWVRATVAIAHAQWAWRNSLLGLDISYWSPEDPYLNPENSHLDGWTSYFEPVQQDTQNTVLVQLSCAAAARAWEQYGNYASSYADALIQRQKRVEAIRRLPLRPRRYFVDAANGFWKAHIHDASRVLGVHLRGTDKYVMQVECPFLAFPEAASMSLQRARFVPQGTAAASTAYVALTPMAGCVIVSRQTAAHWQYIASFDYDKSIEPEYYPIGKSST
eukprot:6179220-Pleurochrysis_carterae.AAC.4